MPPHLLVSGHVTYAKLTISVARKCSCQLRDYYIEKCAPATPGLSNTQKSVESDFIIAQNASVLKALVWAKLRALVLSKLKARV